MLRFTNNFPDACNTNDVNKGAAMWVMTHLLDEAPKDTLERIMKSLKGSLNSRDQTALRSYCEAAN